MSECFYCKALTDPKGLSYNGACRDCEKRIKRLRALYARIPAVKCKGLCTEACGPVMMTELEAKLIEWHFKPLGKCGSDLTCPALVAGQCTVYEQRPFVCRAYGGVKSLECPHGCCPESLKLPENIASNLMREIMKVGGGIVSTLPKEMADKFGLN